MDLNRFDKSTFTTNPYVRKIDKPWGYEIHWVPEGMPYMGKLLHIDGGKRLSLQVHEQKQESYWLINGKCNLIMDNEKGELSTIQMVKGKGYTTRAVSYTHLVAVTPFLLHAGEGPFTGFSFINTEGTPTLQMQALMKIPKVEGKPSLSPYILGLEKLLTSDYPQKDFRDSLKSDSSLSISILAQDTFKWVMRL